MKPEIKERLAEALEDDTESWQAHLAWLLGTPEGQREPDREPQIADCERVLELNKEAGAVLTAAPKYPWRTMQVGDAFVFGSHIREPWARSMVSHINTRLRPKKKFSLSKTSDGLKVTRTKQSVTP